MRIVTLLVNFSFFCTSMEDLLAYIYITPFPPLPSSRLKSNCFKQTTPLSTVDMHIAGAGRRPIFWSRTTRNQPPKRQNIKSVVLKNCGGYFRNSSTRLQGLTGMLPHRKLYNDNQINGNINNTVRQFRNHKNWIRRSFFTTRINETFRTQHDNMISFCGQRRSFFFKALIVISSRIASKAACFQDISLHYFDALLHVDIALQASTIEW